MPARAKADTTQRPFTNRDRHLQRFVEALETKAPGEHQVLVYHGVGGIGKSRLSRELGLLLNGESKRADALGLSKRVEAGRLPWARVSFEMPTLRSGPRALFRMQQDLRNRHGLRFPIFELAFGIWWEEAFPNSPLKEKPLPFLEEADVLASVIEIARDIPGLGLGTV